MATKLNLRIIRVKCIDETGGWLAERAGNDEIYLGGFSIQQNGATTKVPTIPIYADFDDGDVKTFNPPAIFHTFQLGASLPKEFGMGLILIEKDGGGADNGVLKVAEKAKELITTKLPAVGGVLGAAISVVATPLINWVLNKIIGGIQDDLFPVQMISIKIPSATFNWLGSNHSAEKTIKIKAHDGEYDLTYDWELV